MFTTLLSIGISAVALSVSVLTAWFTLFRRGKLGMTQPTLIVFGRDFSGKHPPVPVTKLYLRTLLFSTSKRGQVVESLHVTLESASGTREFPVWVYGEERLARGSGLHVSFEGVTCNHHFMLASSDEDYEFLEGAYTLRVYVKLLNEPRPRQLFAIPLQVIREDAEWLADREVSLFFDWLPNRSRYVAHADRRNQKMPGAGVLFT